MKFKIQKSDFLKLMSQPAEVAKGNNITPILENVMIEAGPDNQITIMATDTTISVKNFGEEEVHQEGRVLVSGAILYKAVNSMTDTIEFRVEDYNIFLVSGNTELDINGQDISNYPEVEFPREDLFIEADKEVLREGLAKTAVTISTDDTKPHLMGVHVVADDEKYIIESTDGHACSRCTFVNSSPFRTKEMGIIINTRGVQQLQKFIASNEKIKLYPEQKRLHVRSDNSCLTVGLVDAKYPPVGSIIPKLIPEQKVVFQKAPLLAAVKRIEIFGDKKAETGVLLQIENKICTVTSIERVRGIAKDKIFVENEREKLFELGVSAHYLENLLAQMPGDKVEAYINHENLKSATVWTPADSANYLVILMPLRVN